MSGDDPGAQDGGVVSGPAARVFPVHVARPRIMIVGDSISAGPGCYKKYLAEKLAANGITAYEFVGEYADDCHGDVRHSAVSCSTSAHYTEETFSVSCDGNKRHPGMARLTAAHNPDLVMIQLGVNDIGGEVATQSILNNYTTLVEQARARNPRVVVMVAQIHRIIMDHCKNTKSTADAEALVKAVPAWAASVSTSASPVLVADLWTNSDPREAFDCVHPNDAGARRMADNWYAALAPILR